MGSDALLIPPSAIPNEGVVRRCVGGPVAQGATLQSASWEKRRPPDAVLLKIGRVSQTATKFEIGRPQ